MTFSMTCEQFETVLPDLLDDETAGAAMTPAVRAHLGTCEACHALYDDLNTVRSTAATLPTLTPSRDLWAGIAARIEAPVVPLVEGAPVPKRRRQLSWRTAGIAATLLVALNLAVSYQMVRRTRAETTVAANDVHPVGGPDTTGMTSAAQETQPSLYQSPAVAAEQPQPRPGGASIVLASVQQGQPRRREAPKAVYDREITRLRAIVDSGRTKLDPATVAILERNLRVIDLAIEQCNEALARDSASTFLIESLNNAYQTKVKLLRIAAAAASRG